MWLLIANLEPGDLGEGRMDSWAPIDERKFKEITLKLLLEKVH